MKRLMEEVMQVPRTRSTSIPSPMWMVRVEEALAEWKERYRGGRWCGERGGREIVYINIRVIL